VLDLFAAKLVESGEACQSDQLEVTDFGFTVNSAFQLLHELDQTGMIEVAVARAFHGAESRESDQALLSKQIEYCAVASPGTRGPASRSCSAL